MAASASDLLLLVGTPGSATTLSANYTTGATSITVASTANWPTTTGVVFAMDEAETVNGQEVQVAGTYREFIGTVATATSITNVDCVYGTDRDFDAGATTRVYVPVSAERENRIVEWGTTEHEQDGTHGVELITSRTEDTDPDPDADFLLTYDTSASALKKVKPSNLGGSTGWTANSLPTVSSVTNNGNRSYDIVFGSTVASLLSPGMRLRTTRTVTAPTQCADLESGSSHYFAKANATGFSTGTTWTISAKIKPESYKVGIICALDDGTNIVQLYMQADGTIGINGGTSGAADSVTSYQSVALDKWQTVSGSITIGTPTGEIRINDVVVPSLAAGSAATTVTISGDETLYIGRASAGNYFDGKIAQVAIFNAIISDATLKTYSSQTMTGAETNCKGFWSLNNTLNDGSASANNLTAFNSAVATNADSPFGQDSNGVTAGTTDYELVMKVNGATATVQVPEGCTIPTSGGVSAVAYSTATSPFGFTLDKGRWYYHVHVRANVLQAAVTSTTLYNPGGFYVTLPTGSWIESQQIFGGVSGSTDAAKDFRMALSTSSGSYSTGEESNTTDFRYDIVDVLRLTNTKSDLRFNVDTPTTYYLLVTASGGGTLTNAGISSSIASNIFFLPSGI